MDNVNTRKKIIGLSCSPSKGFNSDTMLDNFLRGAGEVEGIETEKVYLNDIPFDHYNFNNKSGPAEHETAFRDLTEKIKNADALVIATPTYNFSVPAQLKNFIDRIRFFALDFNQKTKLGQPKGALAHLRTYFLVSGGTPFWAQKILFFAFPPFWLRGVFLYFGARVMGAIYTGDVRSYEDKKFARKCERAGRKFARKVHKCEHHGFLEDIFFRPPQHPD